MSVLAWLVPLALAMGITGLLAFLWSLQNGQYEDLSGAAARILLGRDEDRPVSDIGANQPVGSQEACNSRQETEETTDRTIKTSRMKR